MCITPPLRGGPCLGHKNSIFCKDEIISAYCNSDEFIDNYQDCSLVGSKCKESTGLCEIRNITEYCDEKDTYICSDAQTSEENSVIYKVDCNMLNNTCVNGRCTGKNHECFSGGYFCENNEVMITCHGTVEHPLHCSLMGAQCNNNKCDIQISETCKFAKSGFCDGNVYKFCFNYDVIVKMDCGLVNKTCNNDTNSCEHVKEPKIQKYVEIDLSDLANLISSKADVVRNYFIAFFVLSLIILLGLSSAAIILKFIQKKKNNKKSIMKDELVEIKDL